MKLSAVALFTAFAAAACIQLPTAYATQCTEAQLKMGVGQNTKPGEEAAFRVACPAITEPAGLDITFLSSFNITKLRNLSPCKEPSCTEYLKGQVVLVPDCEYLGLNAKNASEGVLEICVGIADGSLTMEEVEVVFEGITQNMSIPSSTSGSGSAMASAGGSVEGSMEGSMAGSMSESGSGSSSAGSPNDIGSAPGTVPSPTTSGSSVVTIAGAAVASSVTLASFLLM